jgi:hypothetical protein
MAALARGRLDRWRIGKACVESGCETVALRCGGDGDRRKKTSAWSTATLGGLFIRVPPGSPVAAPSSVWRSL